MSSRYRSRVWNEARAEILDVMDSAATSVPLLDEYLTPHTFSLSEVIIDDLIEDGVVIWLRRPEELQLGEYWKTPGRSLLFTSENEESGTSNGCFFPGPRWEEGFNEDNA
jgi:hypothetical protein